MRFRQTLILTTLLFVGCVSVPFDAAPGPHAGEGTLVVEPARAPASTHQQFLFHYKPGPAGILPGGGFRIRLPIDPVHPWLGFFAPQTLVRDRRGQLDCVIRRDGEFVRIAIPEAQQGGWAACLVGVGGIAEGEELVLSYWTLAARASGFHPVEAQTRFHGGRGGLPLAAPIGIDVTPREARVLRVFAPSHTRAGEPFDVAVVALDEFGNRAEALRGMAEVTFKAEKRQAIFDEGAAGVVIVSGFRIGESGFHWPEARWIGEHPFEFTVGVHPIRVLPDSDPHAAESILWGDPEADGGAGPDAYAREVSRLDFSGRERRPAALTGGVDLYSWGNRGSGYDDDLNLFEPDPSWLERSLADVIPVMAGSSAPWGRPGLDNETDLEPGAGGLTALVALEGGEISEEGWATTGERIYLRASREGRTIRISVAGCSPLAMVEVVIVDSSGRHNLTAVRSPGREWYGEVTLPPSDLTRLVFVKTAQENGEVAWSRIWRVGGGAGEALRDASPLTSDTPGT